MTALAGRLLLLVVLAEVVVIGEMGGVLQTFPGFKMNFFVNGVKPEAVTVAV